MSLRSSNVCVIIPAFRAASTIGRAISSALAQAEVSEVFVVDDASGDDTLDAARLADDGSSRLQLLRMEQNSGPAAARNLAIAQSRSEFISVLDSDDFFLPGRFARLLAEPSWDIIADNIAFIVENASGYDISKIPAGSGDTTLLTADEFIRRNRPIAGRPRAEYGFLKPTIRRSFLERHALQYDERLRLGEDYILYLRALGHGARFKILYSCGYVAIQRALSLSGRFRTGDLQAMALAEQEIIEGGLLSASAARLAHEHCAAMMRRVRHRQFLDTKRQHGFARAISAHEPFDALGIFKQILIDKSRVIDMISSFRGRGDSEAQVRMLL